MANSTSATVAANAPMGMRVTRTVRSNSSASPPVYICVRCGRIAVCTDWKSWSGARAISSTLKVKPASAAPSAPGSVALTMSGPALRNVCSLSITSNTAAAKPVPRASVNSGSPSRSTFWVVLTPKVDLVRTKGTTVRLAIGAATMPSATASCPSLIPTATATAKRQRLEASSSTRAPYAMKRWCPARKPRAK